MIDSIVAHADTARTMEAPKNSYFIPLEESP